MKTRKKLIILAALVAGIPLVLLGVAVLGYQDLQVISTPGNPASGFVRFFANSSGLGCLTSSGGNCLSAAPSGTAGGDLSGSYPNPTVAQVNGAVVPTSAGVAGTNGSKQLVAATAANVYGLWSGTCSSTTYLSGSGVCSTPGGGGGGGLTQISQTTLASPAASITFSGISGSYSNLYMTYVARSANASSADNFYIQFNSDTMSDYVLVYGDFGSGYSGGLAGASATAAAIGTAPGSTAAANASASGSCLLPAYAGTTFSKMIVCNHVFVQGSTVASNILQGQYSSNWSSTSAITSIVIKLASGGNFVTGTTFTLYGQQ